jgi:para-aminobenzoate synthetase component 1
LFEHPPHTAIAIRELARSCAATPPARVRAEFDARFDAWRGEPHAWLLDSALPHPRLGRFSFAGADPYLVLRARGRRVEWMQRRDLALDPAAASGALEGDPLDLLRRALPRAPATACGHELPFTGGAVGYFGYELGLAAEGIEPASGDDLALPDLVFLFADRVLAFDAIEGALYACGMGFGDSERAAHTAAESRVGELLGGPPRRARASCRRGAAALPRADARLELDEARHARAVAAILREIERGNAYQACLTRRESRSCTADPWDLYVELRRQNPAPFAAFVSLPEVAIACSSPERFLALDPKGRVECRPIKGTIARGRDAASDAAQRAALLASEKDRAENLMITDLVRNDLGRVCVPGSIEVPELQSLECYARVFQLVSSVRGQLEPGRDAIDLVRAAFPPGSMTGAPKIAAMRLLSALEPVRRGVYSGALGYLDARGGMDLCVVIRTILLREGRAYLHSGGGIVADSDPGGEWQESRAKLDALEAALDAFAAADPRPLGALTPPIAFLA